MEKYLLLIMLCLITILCIGCSQDNVKGSLIEIKQAENVEKPVKTEKSIVRITIKPIKPQSTTKPTTRPVIQPKPTSRPVIFPPKKINHPPIIPNTASIIVIEKHTFSKYVDVKYIIFCIGGLLAILGLCVMIFLKVYSAIFAVILGSLLMMISLLYGEHPWIILTLPIFGAITLVWSFFYSRVFHKIKPDSG